MDVGAWNIEYNRNCNVLKKSVFLNISFRKQLRLDAIAFSAESVSVVENIF